jgi:ABC-type phosphate/phosphonate transport system ATPase subunit
MNLPSCLRRQQPGDDSCAALDDQSSLVLARLLIVMNMCALSLSQVVIIGDQSSGKSTLVLRLSGVSLPRKAGTCTRTPTEIRMVKDGGPQKYVVKYQVGVNASLAWS